MGLEGSQHPLGHVWAAVLVIIASSLALSGALGVQQSKTTGWISLEFLVGLWFSARSGMQHPWIWMMRTIPEFAPSLLQHCLCAVL